MRISIVIPSYNQASFLEQTIRSVIDQDYEDKEVILMDGGSVDGSLEIIKRYAKHFSYWQSTPDGGQSEAIHNGFQRTTGAIIGWLNSDDTLASGTLARIASMAHSVGPNCVFYGGLEVIDADGVIQERFPGTAMIHWIAKSLGPTISQPGTFFGRKAYFSNGGLDISLGYGMDLDLWSKFLARDVPFVFIPAIQGHFRSHSEQKGHSKKWSALNETEKELIYRRYGLSDVSIFRKRLAFVARGLHKLFNGTLLQVLCFRLLRHRRARNFKAELSA